MVVHNPTPTAPGGDGFEATSPDVRLVPPRSDLADAEYRRALISGPPDPFEDWNSDDEVNERTLKFFDGYESNFFQRCSCSSRSRVLRENEGANVFIDRPHFTDSDVESSDDGE